MFIFEQYFSVSQDDDENYDYGSFSTYNHFQSATEMKKPEVIMETITKIIENEKHDESLPENKNGIDLELGSNSVESKLKSEDEVIEDLDLKVDEEVLGNIDTVVNESCIEFEGHEALSKSEEIVEKVDIPNISNINQEDLTPSELPLDDILTEPPSLEQIDEPPCYIGEIAMDTVDLKCTDGLSVTEDLQTLQEPVDVKEPIVKDSLKDPLNKNNDSQDNDDDFGDFDDFQFASVSDKTGIVIDNCENPWGNSEPADNDFGNFGDFKASFDNSEVNINESTQKDITNSDVHTTIEHIPENDDDFGDFNDFKTSTIDDASVATSLRNDDESSPPPLLTLQSLENESEFQEKVNSLINNIFYEEMPEYEEVFEGKLETHLSVTWKHLLEVDVRQPYMVNCNNSLAQKTLLKALCIDSRNIVSGFISRNILVTYH